MTDREVLEAVVAEAMCRHRFGERVGAVVMKRERDEFVALAKVAITECERALFLEGYRAGATDSEQGRHAAEQ